MPVVLQPGVRAGSPAVCGAGGRERGNMKRTINILVTLGLAQGLAYAQPAVSSVLNAASYDAVVSPGCWVAIFGNNLAPATLGADTVPLPTTLGGVSVTVGS